MSKLTALAISLSQRSLSPWTANGVGLRLLTSASKIQRGDATIRDDIVPSLTREPIRPRRPFYKKFEIYRWVSFLFAVSQIFMTALVVTDNKLTFRIPRRPKRSLISNPTM